MADTTSTDLHNMRVRAQRAVERATAALETSQTELRLAEELKLPTSAMNRIIIKINRQRNHLNQLKAEQEALNKTSKTK